MAKRILVIGCGASGLPAMKCCVDEGLEPVCLERTDEMGGLWNYKEQVRDDQACVMKSTIINTSKEMMAYSDYPMPAEYPNYLHNSQIMEYFRNYMKKFDLERYVKYNKEAVAVKPADSFDTTGKWDVEIHDHKTGEVEHTQFDGVLVCTGHHAKKNIPTINGQDGFQGKIIHSQDLKHNGGWDNKRAIVIGIGNSGVDAANELAKVTSRVFLSTRRGTWLVPRNLDNGFPFDTTRVTRMWDLIAKVIPSSVFNGLLENEVNRLYDHKMYGLQCSHRFAAQHPNMSSDLPMNISTGRVIIKGDIRRLTKTGVEFMDGTYEDNIDLVVLATGYQFGFPFIDKSVLDVKNNRVGLYKFMFPPDLKQPTLAIIGCIQPIGAIMPVAELQCRLATRVFKGLLKLPSRMAMQNEISEKEAAMRARYVDSTRHTIQVDFVDFMDQLADIVGCKPNLRKYLITDPVLAVKCFFGPCVPFQYRMEGPGKWEGARDAVVTAVDRIKKPFQNRPLPARVVGGTMFTPSVILGICVVLLAFIIRFLFL